MNEHEPASQTTPTAPPPAPEKPSVLRKILFGILAVMIVALIYEYGFVLRSYRNAEQTIDDLIEQQGAAAPDEKATPAVVQQKFGKTPLADVQDTEDYYVEHYQWRRWLPWKTFDIYVIYEQGTPRTLFYSTRPDPPTEGDLPVKYDFAPIAGASPGATPPSEGEVPAEPSAGDDAAESDAPPSETEDAPAADAPAEPAGESSDEPADTPAEPASSDEPPANKPAEPAVDEAPADEPTSDSSETDETPE